MLILSLFVVGAHLRPVMLILSLFVVGVRLWRYLARLWDADFVAVCRACTSEGLFIKGLRW